MACRGANPRDCMHDELKARLAEELDRLSVALSANHDLRDERDSLRDLLRECAAYIVDDGEPPCGEPGCDDCKVNDLARRIRAAISPE